MFAEHLSSKTRTLKMRTRTASLGACPMHRFRVAHSVSHGVSSHAFSVTQAYQACVSSGQTTFRVFVISRSQPENTEQAAQYSVARGSMGGGPDEEPHATANTNNPAHSPRIMKPPPSISRETNLGLRKRLVHFEIGDVHVPRRPRAKEDAGGRREPGVIVEAARTNDHHLSVLRQPRHR